MLKIAEIRRHCFYSSSISKGREIVARNAFEELNISNDSVDCTISAHVKGSGGKWYQTSVVVDTIDSEIVDYSCECPAYQQTSCMCKHGVALALLYQQAQKLEREKNSGAVQRQPKVLKRASDSSINTLLNLYSANQGDLLPGSYIHEIDLEPSFAFGLRGSLSVSLRVGRDRMYVVKDIYAFLKACSLGQTVQYGKNLKFSHCRTSFTEDALGLLDLLQDIYAVQERDRAVNIFSIYYSNRSTSIRAMDLQPYGCERVLSKYLSESRPVPGLNLNVVQGNPQISLQMNAVADGAVINLNPSSFHPIFGTEHLYIVCPNQIWQCSNEFALAVKPLLATFGIGRADNFRSPSSDLFISQQDFRPFCKSVMPTISPHLSVITEGFSLDEYMPETAQFSVYLTMPENAPEMSVESRCEVSYGGKVFDLVDDSAEHQAYRDSIAESTMTTLLREYFSAHADGKLYDSCMGEEDVLRLVRDGLPRLREVAEVYADERLLGIKVRPSPKVSIGVSLSSGLLQLDVSSELDDPSEIVRILSAYRKKKRYYRLKNGDLVALDKDAFNLLDTISADLMIDPRELMDGQVSLPQYRAAYLDEMVKQAAGSVEVRRNAAFRRMMADMRSYQDSEFDVPDRVQARLLGYQTDGFRWLATLAQYGLGGILADEMGLGKTLQVLSYLALSGKKALVICPASLVYNWEIEAHRFVPTMRVVTVVGGADTRREIIGNCGDAELVISSYDLLKRDLEYFQRLHFDCMVIDEAQYIKNAGTQAAKAVKCINAPIRFALTGTPIENRLSDLWSIFDFIMPGYLYSYKKFKDEVEKRVVFEEDEEATIRLKAMISPFILRRRKKDVLKDLPDRLEQVVYAKMVPAQEKLYRAMETNLAKKLMKSSDAAFAKEQIKILAELTRLRQVCCSPDLCYEDYDGGSGKVDLVLELIDTALSGGHKILVFSQFTTLLEKLIEKYGSTTEYLYLSGKNNKEQRRDMVSRFQNENIPVFFISLKAGGAGLNLTEADIVLHVDPWWNVAAENQASDRTHRIGQTKEVTVMKVVAKDTIEERILALQAKKAELSERVLGGEELADGSITREDLLRILGGSTV